MGRVAAIDVGCCPHCSIGRWRVLQHVAADRPALNSPRRPLVGGRPDALRHAAVSCKASSSTQAGNVSRLLRYYQASSHAQGRQTRLRAPFEDNFEQPSPLSGSSAARRHCLSSPPKLTLPIANRHFGGSVQRGLSDAMHRHGLRQTSARRQINAVR